jgi:ABC-type ATPase with predicted acetyltransferase domain
MDKPISVMLNRVDFLLKQRATLEQVFGEEWFRNASKKDKQHPAYIRWDLCQRLIGQGGVISKAATLAGIPPIIVGHIP